MKIDLKSKYQYWTLIEKVGTDFNNEIEIGNLISSPYKKENWEVLDRKSGKIKFMCSGTYVCRTLKDISSKEKLKIIKLKQEIKKLGGEKK